MFRHPLLGLLLCSFVILTGCGSSGPRFEGTWKLEGFEKHGFARADMVIKPDATFQTIFQPVGKGQRAATTGGTWKKLASKKVEFHNIKLKDTAAEIVVGVLLDEDTLEITVVDEKHKYLRQKQK
jgi:hypothetical protein